MSIISNQKTFTSGRNKEYDCAMPWWRGSWKGKKASWFCHFRRTW